MLSLVNESMVVLMVEMQNLEEYEEDVVVEVVVLEQVWRRILKSVVVFFRIDELKEMMRR